MKRRKIMKNLFLTISLFLATSNSYAGTATIVTSYSGCGIGSSILLAKYDLLNEATTLLLVTPCFVGAALVDGSLDYLKTAAPAIKKGLLRGIPLVGFLAGAEESMASDDYEAYYMKHPEQNPRAATNLEKQSSDLSNLINSKTENGSAVAR
jgi:hypothetical protein